MQLADSRLSSAYSYSTSGAKVLEFFFCRAMMDRMPHSSRTGVMLRSTLWRGTTELYHHTPPPSILPCSSTQLVSLSVVSLIFVVAVTKLLPYLPDRSQDSAIKRPATETITAEGDIVTGSNTSFSQIFKYGDKLRFRGKSEQFKVRNSTQNSTRNGARRVCRVVRLL